jgi:type I restriction enzyme S subunit
MGQVYSYLRTNALSRDKLNYENGTVRNIHYGDIHTKFPVLFDIAKEHVPFINGSEELPDADSEDYCVEGDLIFADASEDLNDVGKSMEVVRLNGERMLSGQHTILARRNDDTIIVGFSGHLFRSGQIRTQIQKEAQGTKVYAISSTRLKSIEIRYPGDKAEQQKIVDCLTSLDELIAAQTRKVEALKAHKWGLMQRLFPCEGETLPRLRFPEFRGDGDWVTRSMADLLARAAKPVSVDAKTLYREIGVRSHGKGVFHKEPVSGSEIGNKRVFWVVANTLVVNIVFAWEQAVATTSAAEQGMIASHRFPMYLGRPGECDVRFLKYGFLTPQGKHLLGLASPGGAGRNRTLGQAEFEKIGMVVPATLKEQSMIADCLVVIDAQIADETAKRDALKTHNKGLMQQLFPSPKEVKA